MALDWWLDAALWVRAIMLGSLLAATGFVAWRFVILPLRRQPDDDRVALRMEKARPEFRSRLISSIQFSRPGAIEAGTAVSLARMTVAETEELARSLASNEGVYLVPAFVGLGAPHWDAEARGAILGLTRGAGRAHFARGALEAMAYGTCEVLDAMVADSGISAKELRVDGGAALNDWMLEFLAGIVNLPVREAPIARGAAPQPA
jgi:hypothetical protein